MNGGKTHDVSPFEHSMSNKHKCTSHLIRNFTSSSSFFVIVLFGFVLEVGHIDRVELQAIDLDNRVVDALCLIFSGREGWHLEFFLV
jgi:hypothetical protein